MRLWRMRQRMARWFGWCPLCSWSRVDLDSTRYNLCQLPCEIISTSAATASTVLYGRCYLLYGWWTFNATPWTELPFIYRQKACARALARARNWRTCARASGSIVVCVTTRTSGVALRLRLRAQSILLTCLRLSSWSRGGDCAMRWPSGWPNHVPYVQVLLCALIHSTAWQPEERSPWSLCVVQVSRLPTQQYDFCFAPPGYNRWRCRNRPSDALQTNVQIRIRNVVLFYVLCCQCSGIVDIHWQTAFRTPNLPIALMRRFLFVAKCRKFDGGQHSWMRPHNAQPVAECKNNIHSIAVLVVFIGLCSCVASVRCELA